MGFRTWLRWQPFAVRAAVVVAVGLTVDTLLALVLGHGVAHAIQSGAVGLLSVVGTMWLMHRTSIDYATRDLDLDDDHDEGADD